MDIYIPKYKLGQNNEDFNLISVQWAKAKWKVSELFLAVFTAWLWG